jgi:hypothetical protein
MEINETLMKNQNDILDSQLKNYTYCCPLCVSLPEILSFNQVRGTVKLKCKQHGENILQIEDYMEKISMLKQKYEVKIKNKCILHNEQYKYYCKTCEENICQQCIKDKSNNHENHLTYEIISLAPDKKEILYIQKIIEVLLQKKDELMRKVKSLEDKINFCDTLINCYHNNSPNYLLNINLKHLVYGEILDFEKIKNTEFLNQHKGELFNNFIKTNFLQATKGLNQLNLIDKKIENSLIENIIKGIEDNTIFQILKSSNLIQEQKDMVDLKNIKILNLRTNKISSLNFLLKKEFPSLEILSLNDNEIISIDELKNVSFPLLKELYLSKNKIENIDALAQINAPKLNKLWLSNNNINSINILEKVHFPLLLILSLSKNKISDISVFTNKKVKLPNLYELYLDDNCFDLKTFSKVIEDLFLKIKRFYY